MIAWLARSSGSGSAEKSPPPVVARFTVAPTSAPAAGTNAVDLYRPAIALLAELRDNSADQAQFDRYVDGAFDAQTSTFLQKYAKITELIRQGAAATSADWGEQDMQSRMNELSSIRSMFNLVMVESKFAMQQDNPALAIDDALAGMAMAHRLGNGGVLTSKLVEVACDIKAIDSIAGYLPALSPDQLAALRTRLETLPKAGTGAEVMAAEYAFAKSQQNGNVVMLAMVSSMEPFYKDAGEGLDTKTPAEFAAWVDEQVTKYSANMLIKIVAPSLKSIRQPLAVAQAKQAMLRTAIDVQSRGEVAVADSADPFGAGPFQYQKTATGFVLSTQLQDKGAPVKIVAGK
jgi:hypothetical protein